MSDRAPAPAALASSSPHKSRILCGPKAQVSSMGDLGNPTALSIIGHHSSPMFVLCVSSCLRASRTSSRTNHAIRPRVHMLFGRESTCSEAVTLRFHERLRKRVVHHYCLGARLAGRAQCRTCRSCVEVCHKLVQFPQWQNVRCNWNCSLWRCWCEGQAYGARSTYGSWASARFARSEGTLLLISRLRMF